ncbi:UNVERIFIED_CONTAM: hypothetical protein Sradi_3984100 [Sesamum radiatum]|uniref:Uncharacterized protein n=1 Tax=Sesamum radiatum TaxID=300843 RepID=A0AAW2PHL6_SESRA
MKGYLQEMGELTSRLKSFQLHQIPRKEIIKVDFRARLANSLVNCSTRNITVRTLTENLPNVMTIQVETDWRKPLLDYLERSILPADEKEFLTSSPPMFVQGRGEDVLQEIHKGSCGSHVGRLALANKTLRA